ncbi:ADP-ribose pyrophosphatase [Gracilariopsis chorda]|uniref:ADP-ribose pyrophosphatase n=1 Tax=Gracilariopsis chorda TaxID=448386 RepID=A0A2V3IYB5_9FLOR|nr:ADP-ribose pyrophosphatase [Gracilariopsis chorda]|eukprot:PXF47111.1 ADP-ribose pyrophosphatase [Gracilariopsis chorda]
MPPVSEPPISSLIRREAGSNGYVSGSVDVSRIETHASTRWLQLQTISYRFDQDEPNKYDRHWDIVNRATRTAMDVDAVVVLARLRLADDVERVLLVKQFRPPLNAVSVELPAGLVDEGESLAEAALRELKEETGFQGRITRTHAAAALSPGLSAENVSLVEVEVEGTSEGQQLDGNENIEVVSVPLHRMEEALEHMINTEGVVAMHAVSTLALGLRLGLTPR